MRNVAAFSRNKLVNFWQVRRCFRF